MSIITPAGNMNFDWSPNQEALVRTAATGKKEATDKDALYAAAKKVVAQLFVDKLPEEKLGGECPACGEGMGAEGLGAVDGLGEKPMGLGEGEGEGEGMMPPPADAAAALPAATAPKSDAVQAVQELADKAGKAEELAGKIVPALEKVVQDVKAITGEGGAPEMGGNPDEVVLDVEVEGEGKEHEESESPKEEKEEHKDGEKKENPFKKEDKGEKEEPKEEKDEIVQKSVAAKSVALKAVAADTDDFVKLSKISPTTRQKIISFWKDDLGYDAAYAKLMATDFEK